MFSDKQNISILTSLLIEHQVTEAVVCPGSRNAPIVHNLHLAGIECHAITDERCAAFYALGIYLASKRPVAVCVTSGSALLNLLPGIAEAHYRHAPIVVISADRPAERIEQLDSQTILQSDALMPYAKRCVSLPEPSTAADRRLCNRLVNEALAQCYSAPYGPVQINVPISDPLFNFTETHLPEERVIHISDEGHNEFASLEIYAELSESERPLIIIGQVQPNDYFTTTISQLSQHVTVLYEALASESGGNQFEMVIKDRSKWPQLQPDLVIYAGETTVSKLVKEFVETAPDCLTISIAQDGKIHDTFGNLCEVIVNDYEMVLLDLLNDIKKKKKKIAPAYFKLWQAELKAAREQADNDVPPTPEGLIVKTFEDKLPKKPTGYIVHYANSLVVRYANMYARHYVYVNRGVNGIEGSISTAAGHSLATDHTVFCVTGDLSFFYDSNALWCDELGPNLRILLINNHKGAIFDTLKGLPDDEAHNLFTKGSHYANAEGICSSYDVTYKGIDDLAELPAAIDWLFSTRSMRPILLECIIK